MLKIGEIFLYGENGICKVDDIVERTLRNESKKYYVLKPVFSGGSTIFIPIDNESLQSRLYSTLTKKEIESFPSIAKGEKPVWITNDNERSDFFTKVILSCNRKELIKMLKSIHEHKLELKEKGKHLRAADERFMKKAEKMLKEEVALVMQIPIESVISYIFEN